jgi:hypothetical protein
MSSKAPRTIHIDPESDLARSLATADDEPVLLESNGVRFRVIRVDDDPWADYDPEKVREGLRKFSGMISPEEADRIKELIYRGREEGTRPLDRP